MSDCWVRRGVGERGRYLVAALAMTVLAACSNGRGSLSEPQSAPVTTDPPPTTPVPPTTPPPQPPPEPPPTTPPTPPPEPPPAEPPPADPGAALSGYWKGTVTDTDSNRVSQAVALVDHEGEAQLIVLGASSGDDAQFVLYGNLCCAGRFDEDVPGKRFLNNRSEEADVDIEVVNGRLAGQMEFRNREYAVSLAPSAEYGEALTLQSLAGVYTQTTTPLFGAPTTMTLTIDANGQLTGSHTNGCAFNGRVSIPNVQRNMVRIEVEMSSCGDRFGSSRQWNGRYDGLGLLLRDAVSPSNPSLREDVFYHSAVGPTWLGPQSVGR